MRALSVEDVELMRIEHAWHSLAIWGDTRNKTYLHASLLVVES